MQAEQGSNQHEIDQLELELSQLNHALVERYCLMGKKILELAEREEREINGLVDRIIALGQTLSTLRQEQRCPACALLNDSGSRFCKYCGCPLRQSDPYDFTETETTV